MKNFQKQKQLAASGNFTSATVDAMNGPRNDRVFRDSTCCTSMSAVSTPMPTTRASGEHHGVRALCRSLRQAIEPRLLDLADLYA